jgi:putative oxidoreductase
MESRLVIPPLQPSDRGYEYPLMRGLVMLAIALRGGGPYSLDRKVGREL